MTPEDELALLKQQVKKAHDDLVFLATELGLATDGTLPVAVSHVRELIRKYRHDLTLDHLAALNERFGGSVIQEWGIEYVNGSHGDGTLDIQPFQYEQHASGMFKRYGEPGDKLVIRVVGPWKVLEEKPEDG